MEPFNFSYRVDSTKGKDKEELIGEIKRFIKKVREDGFEFTHEPISFYDGSDNSYGISDKTNPSADIGGCGALFAYGSLVVFNEPGNRLLKFMKEYEIEPASVSDSPSQT